MLAVQNYRTDSKGGRGTSDVFEITNEVEID